MSPEERRWERFRTAATLLRQAEQPVRVLSSLAWAPEVRDEFFARAEREMPRVEYPVVDPTPTLERTRAAVSLLEGQGAPEAWLRRVATGLELAAHMLAGVGTPELTRRSIELYGEPAGVMVDGVSRPIDLARHVDEVAGGLAHDDLGVERPERHDAAALAIHLQEAVTLHFGDDGPDVEIVDHLSANVVAGPSRIRVRRGATFSDTDLGQLVHHELLTHVATAYNGRNQSEVPILASSHPGTTRTQEGLAVFAEYISGALAPDRFRRLADRVLAIQMALSGGDFLDVYRFFMDRTHSPEQAFENARRVFRGGVLAGGYPFTKDIVYLDGLLRVHNFLRAAVVADRRDCLGLLVCGKIDIDDLPAMCELAEAGLLRPPRIVPPWLADQRFLIAYLTYSSFLGQVRLDRVVSHYRELLDAAPEVTRMESLSDKTAPGGARLARLRGG